MRQILKWSVAAVVAVVITFAGCVTEKPKVTKPAAKPAVTKAAAGKAKAAKAAKAKAAKAKASKSVCQKIDANKDGKLTHKEHKTRLAQWFKELDANKDNKLSPDEFHGKRFTNMDVNKDGAVTLQEYVVLFVGKHPAIDKTRGHAKMDANGDNKVTPVEIIGYRKRVFTGIDADKSAKITPKEFKAHTAKQFTSADANKDGSVTVDEMIAVIVIPAPKVAKKAAPPAKK
ncbi:EF-hand domain-containing protein [Verrucomicrobiota bacterium]